MQLSLVARNLNTKERVCPTQPPPRLATAACSLMSPLQPHWGGLAHGQGLGPLQDPPRHSYRDV